MAGRAKQRQMEGMRPGPADREMTASEEGSIEETGSPHLPSPLSQSLEPLVDGSLLSWRDAAMQAGLRRKSYSPPVRFLLRLLLRPGLLRGIAQPEALHFLGTVAERIGREELGRELLRRASVLGPAMAATHLDLAQSLLAQGRFNEAETALRAHDARKPGNGEILVSLALSLQGQGKLAEAERLLGQFLKSQPKHLPAITALASILHGLGRRGEALDLARLVTNEDPKNAKAHSNLGNILLSQGQIGEAEACYRHALLLAPDQPEALCNLGNLLFFRRDQRDEGLDLVRRALVKSPSFLVGLINLATMLNALGRHEEEEKAARRAVDLDPGSSDAATSLANSLFKQEKFEEALFHYQRAAKISPHHPVARNHLGVALQRLERADEAIEEYRHAARLAPETPSYLTNLAGALCASGLYEEGLACYRKLRRLLSTPLLNLYDAMAMPIILSSHGQIAKARSHVQEGMKKLLEQDVTIKDPMVESHVLSFFLAYHGLDDRPLQEAIASFFRKACPSLTWAAPHCENSRKPEAGQRIKVGFVSSFFRETHTVGRLFKGLIAGLPRERFEVVLFPVGTRFSDQELSYHKAADRMVPLPKNLEDARQTIARERLDILYYPDIGMVPFTNFLAHARLAPVQCVAWGHPDTTGLPSLDYFVSAEAIEPVGAEAHYTEKLVALSRIPLCYTPAKLPAQGLKSRQELGLPEGKRLYVCTQSLFKVHPDMDAAFAKILAEDEKAVIVMISFRNNNWVNILKTRLARSIPRYKDRFHFSPALNHEDFLALNAVADALLDTFHFSGGLTTLEAFTVGQPVVTLPGDFMRGRVSLGYYRQMEMDELIARDADHYAALAVRLANDIPWREAMKAKILEKRKAVFEDAEGLRVFAEFLEKAVRRGA